MQADVKDFLIDQGNMIPSTVKQSVSSLGGRLRNLPRGPLRDRQPSTTRWQPPTPHLCPCCPLHAGRMPLPTVSLHAAAIPAFPSPPLHPSPCVTLPPSPCSPLLPSRPSPRPYLIGPTFPSNFLCGCVVSVVAFSPPIVRFVSPSPRSHAFFPQSCAPFLTARTPLHLLRVLLVARP